MALVGERGYAQTTVADVARHAGVSTNAFYARYENKGACALAAWDAIVADLDAGLESAASGRPPADTVRDAFADVIGVLVQAARTNPEDLRFALSGVLAMGPEGPEGRRRLVGLVAARARQALGHALEPAPISDIAVTAVAGGAVAVVEQRLRSGKPRWPRSLIGDLAAWGASYVTERRLDEPRRDERSRLHPAPPPSPQLARLPRGHSRAATTSCRGRSSSSTSAAGSYARSPCSRTSADTPA